MPTAAKGRPLTTLVEPALGWTYLSREALARAKAQLDEESMGVRDEIRLPDDPSGLCRSFLPRNLGSAHTCPISPSTNDPRVIASTAARIAEAIFEQGAVYTKCGVMLEGLEPESGAQQDLFAALACLAGGAGRHQR